MKATIIIALLLITGGALAAQTSRIALRSHSGKQPTTAEAGFGLPGDTKEKSTKKKAADTIAVKPFGTAADTLAAKKPRSTVKKAKRKKH